MALAHLDFLIQAVGVRFLGDGCRPASSQLATNQHYNNAPTTSSRCEWLLYTAYGWVLKRLGNGIGKGVARKSTIFGVRRVAAQLNPTSLEKNVDYDPDNK